MIEDFVDEHLSNWYVRLCRRRFWKGEYEQDKICAYQTLYECLETVVRLMAPFHLFSAMQFFKILNAVTEQYLKLNRFIMSDFPIANEAIDRCIAGRKNAIGTGCFFFDFIASEKSKYQSSSAIAKSIDSGIESQL